VNLRNVQALAETRRAPCQRFSRLWTASVSHEFQIFDIAQPLGMFSTLTYCVFLARACEERGIEPYIIASSPFYLSPNRLSPQRGNDWFSYYFDHRRLRLADSDIAAMRKENRVIAVWERSHINLFARGGMDREISNDFSKFSEARRLFDKHFVIKPDVLDEINAVDASAGSDWLGIHYRGTDRTRESEPVEYQTVVDAALRYFPHLRSVFAATDEELFLAFARSHMPDRKIATFGPTAARYHKVNQADNYCKGLHALADCILLSRCKGLVKTSSALSAWSKVFAPDMDVVLVGKPYSNPWKRVNPWYNLTGLGYFPETLLYRWEPQAMAENRVLAIIADRPRT
jgi:hypothetical protein